MLAGGTFIPELHLTLPEFTYSACAPITQHRERIQKFRETVDLSCIYNNELEKSCFGHDSACSDCKDLPKRIVSDSVFKGRAYEIAMNPKCDGYQRGLTSMVHKVFDQKRGSGTTSKKEQF